MSCSECHESPFGSSFGSGGLVFVSRWGEPLYPDTVTALMTKLINRHNKPVTPRPSRCRTPGYTTYATCTRPRLLLAGVPVHVVAARLGHADPYVTLRVYSHVLREHAATAGDIFTEAITRRSRLLLANPLARPRNRDDRQQRLRCSVGMRSSRLGLSWAGVFWLEGCPQVKQS